MHGVSGAYLTYPVAPGLLDATVVFAQPAAEAGVRSVVNMSQISARREAASNQTRQHWLAERLLEIQAGPAGDERHRPASRAPHGDQDKRGAY